MPAVYNAQQTMQNALHNGVVIPAFNIPYLPMMQPVIEAVADENCFALITTARLEWIKFESRGMDAVYAEYQRHARPGFTALHLDHIPVIDEDQQIVEFFPLIQHALELGFPSVMIDGSRLSLEENIRVTRQVVQYAHRYGAAVEAELGAVLGHESGPLPPYDELFQSGKGFTDIDECQRFVSETGCDWLSVAVGNIHGAVARATKDQKKVQARLNLEHLAQLATVAQIPLVLHGGSGIRQEYILPAIKHGIAKINVATEIRQAFEQTLAVEGSVECAQRAVYERTRWLLNEYYHISNTRRLVNPT